MTGYPEQLCGDPQRQAVPSIHGTVYQAWWSIDAWLRLIDADEVIYLEGAEDFDIVRNDRAITVQVKRNTETISLGNAKAYEALENFWSLHCKEINRRINFHYLTTSSVAMERDANFGGAKGIDAWRAAKTNINYAELVANYIVKKLKIESSLRSFLVSSPIEIIQKEVIQPFHWLTDQPDLDVVKRSVLDRISVQLSAQRSSPNLAKTVAIFLESRFWELIVEPSGSQRCLTRGDLLRTFEVATNTYLPIPIDQLPDLIGNASPGLGLLSLLLEKVPKPPEPLLNRSYLIDRLKQMIDQRKVVLLIGTIHKGKSTLAQIVASLLCPEAWWVNLSLRTETQVDNVLLALARRIEKKNCPSLIVIDDLDISPHAYHVYGTSLEVVLHRAFSKGCGVILTARGGTTAEAVFQHFNNIEH